MKLGHAVRRLDEQLDLARTDLDSATALITARPLAGDDLLADEVVDKGRALWRANGPKFLAELRDRVRVRQESAGDVAYRLEPDLKDGHGGLRDVQSLWWAQEGGLDLRAEDLIDLDHCYDVLLRARVALHRSTGRPGEILRLEDQDAAAAAGGWQRRRPHDDRRRRGRSDGRLALRRELGSCHDASSAQRAGGRPRRRPARR